MGWMSRSKVGALLELGNALSAPGTNNAKESQTSGEKA
jgi:hypothetical protein